MQVRNAAIWLAVGVSVGLSFALLWRSVFVTRALAQDAVLNLGAVTSEIRFDESMGSMRPLPVVPKDWRFVGVSNGEKGNVNNLWFEGRDGHIYMVQGFTTSGRFIVREDHAQKLTRR